ncbi:MAG: hypothetical protein IJ716_11495 [Lachnospiraceae bacterium]|nr:hypothetical protein [Lachnospiraceae bacterium]
MKPIYKVYIAGIIVIGVLLGATQLSINDNGAKLGAYVEYVLDLLGEFGSKIKGIFDGTIGIDVRQDFGFRSI